MRKQRNTISYENETGRKQSKSSFSAPKTKTKFGWSLIIIIKNECHSNIIVDRLQGIVLLKPTTDTRSIARLLCDSRAICWPSDVILAHFVPTIKGVIPVHNLFWKFHDGCNCFLVMFVTNKQTNKRDQNEHLVGCRWTEVNKFER